MNSIDLESAADILNNLPFIKTPPGMKFRKITPATLFFENDKAVLSVVCEYLRSQSEKRSSRSEQLRGKNLARHQNKFIVGDLVKFNLSDTIGFGKIASVNGKLYVVKRLDKNMDMHIHACQLEKLTIPENYLLQLLNV